MNACSSSPIAMGNQIDKKNKKKASFDMKENTSGFSKFLLLFAGEMISSIGSGLTSFGLGVYIFQKTGRAADMALVTLMGFLPTLLLSLPAGTLADRHDRRLLMMIGDGLSALGIFYILFCLLQGEISLWQICLGVFVSAFFSALLEPAFRATITDLLTPDEYSKAAGLMSLAQSARFLISPVIAGALLAVADIKVLLVIDACTFFPTVFAAAAVKNSIKPKTRTDHKEQPSFLASMKEGWQSVSQNRGLLILVLVSSLLTCFMGSFQILAQPIILAFANSATLGAGETVCACGMLASSLWLGAKGIQGGYLRIMSTALFAAGLCMAGFAWQENIWMVCIFGFLFFMALPFANNCLDCLVRQVIPDRLQGRAWGMISFLSQIGYVAAYTLAGSTADHLAALFHISVGRGSALILLIAGLLLSGTALGLLGIKPVQHLEKRTV